MDVLQGALYRKDSVIDTSLKVSERLSDKNPSIIMELEKRIKIFKRTWDGN